MEGWPTRDLPFFKIRDGAGILLGEEAPYRLYAGVRLFQRRSDAAWSILPEQQLDIYVKEHLIDGLKGCQFSWTQRN